jgi:hypothetical protein
MIFFWYCPSFVGAINDHLDLKIDLVQKYILELTIMLFLESDVLPILFDPLNSYLSNLYTFA